MLRRLTPSEPDWLEECALASIVDMQRMLGHSDAAQEITSSLPERSSLRSRLERRQRGPAASPEQSSTLLALQPAIRALYAGDLQRAEEAFSDLDESLAPYVGFYLGEIDLLRHQPSRALEHYARAVQAHEEDQWGWYRFFASLRMAEAYSALQERDAAAKALEHALDGREQKDLLRHVVRARKHYFENGDEVLAPAMRADVRDPGASSSAEPSPR